MAQLRVFLSHSSQDKPFADVVVSAVRAAGADVWYDEHNLGAGALRDEIMHQLADRPVFVVLLSKAAFASRWVRDECEWAYNLSLREPERLILPITAAAYEPRDFNAMLYLEAFKRIEAANGEPYSHPEVVAKLLAVLGLKPGSPFPDRVRLAIDATLMAVDRFRDALDLLARRARDQGNEEEDYRLMAEAEALALALYSAMTAVSDASKPGAAEDALLKVAWSVDGAALHAQRFGESR